VILQLKETANKIRSKFCLITLTWKTG